MKLASPPAPKSERRGSPKRRGRSAQKFERRKAAEFQIHQLLELAIHERKDYPELAQRHAEIAWRLSTRFNVKLRESRNLFCHYCKRYIVSVEDARHRLGRKKKTMRITCLHCGMTYRHPLGRTVA